MGPRTSAMIVILLFCHFSTTMEEPGTPRMVLLGCGLVPWRHAVAPVREVFDKTQHSALRISSF